MQAPFALLQQGVQPGNVPVQLLCSPLCFAAGDVCIGTQGLRLPETISTNATQYNQYLVPQQVKHSGPQLHKTAQGSLADYQFQDLRLTERLTAKRDKLVFHISRSLPDGYLQGFIWQVSGSLGRSQGSPDGCLQGFIWQLVPLLCTCTGTAESLRVS